MNTFWNLDRHPASKPALIGADGTTLSYGDLGERASLWQSRIIEASPSTARPLVALEFATSFDAIASYLGALQAGFPVLVLEPGQLAKTPAFAAIYRPDVIVSGGANGLLVHAGSPHDGIAPHPDLRLLLSTSGSTGDPKLVRLSAQNIGSNASSIAEYLAITPKDRAITTLPLFYSYGLSVLNSYLAAGAALILTGHSVIEPEFWDCCRRNKATSLALVPHQFDLLDKTGFAEMVLPDLRYITQAGGRLAPEMVGKFADQSRKSGWQLFIMYGQTEAAPRISYVPPQTLPDSAETIGQAIPGGQLHIVDETGHAITGTNIPGELVYSGPNVMMGYAVSRSDLTLGAGTDVLHTGDIAERTELGFFRIVGRTKRFVKLFGLRINLDQIEAGLLGTGIAAQAVAVEDQLVLLLSDDRQTNAARDWLTHAYGIPGAEILTGQIPEVPRLASGKTDHQRLRQLANDVVLREQSLPPNQSGESLEQVMMQATLAKSIGPTDSFISLGGNSLSYLRVQMALENRLGRAPDHWEELTLAELNALRPAGTTSRTKSYVGIDMLLRVFAIVLVISQHASDYRVIGGAWILIMVMGYSAARFQSRLIVEGRGLRLAAQMLYPILPLYFAFLSGYFLFRDTIPHDYLFLIANYFVVRDGSLLVPFWFVSLYTQIVLLCAIAAKIPSIRNALKHDPFKAASTALVVLLAVNFTLLASDYVDVRFPAFPQRRGLLECLPIFLLGWVMRAATNTRQTVISGALAVAVVTFFTQTGGSMSISILLPLAMITLFFDRQIALPWRLGRFVQGLASITLFSYLLQGIAVNIAMRFLPHGIPSITLALILTFSAAYAAVLAFNITENWFVAAQRRLAAA